MTKKELISFLTQNDFLKTKRIIEAFDKIDRKDFVLKKYASSAYDDYPLSIGFNQTISQPSTVAFMIELLKPEKGDRILDVGSGSGWTTALLGYIAGKNGKVFGVEIIPELVLFSRDNLEKYSLENTKIYQARINELGLKDKAPFNKILVSAKARDIPEALINQLKIGGVMVIPISNSLFKITKKKTGIEKQEIPGFVFVPLIY
ncbi:MAG: protein-L-isoaspartate O-methyltransferase [Candidatus Pacebacteria bacterium]|nr:protein-L-isoaspartate O-methyltransferase [Candidatus Paceibacterota bacterium]